MKTQLPPHAGGSVTCPTCGAEVPLYYDEAGLEDAGWCYTCRVYVEVEIDEEDAESD